MCSSCVITLPLRVPEVDNFLFMLRLAYLTGPYCLWYNSFILLKGANCKTLLTCFNNFSASSFSIIN